MIRFAWLQSRTQTLVGYALLAAVAIAATITGIQLSHLYHALVAHCTSSCDLATGKYLSRDSFMDRLLDILARAVPALIGMFWGAPLLAREFETGTYRLAWTQSVPRARWLVVRWAMGALVAVILAGLFSLTVTWWYRDHDKLDTSAWAVFDRRDIAPVAYTLFAFAVGVLLGAVIRRNVAAMAATLAVFAAVRVAMSIWVRPHLMAAAHQVLSLRGAGPSSRVGLGIGSSNGGPTQLFVNANGPARSWTLSSHLVTQSGHEVSSGQIAAFLRQHCPHAVTPPPGGEPSGPGVHRVVGPNAGRACLVKVTKAYDVAVHYQPGNRYWVFQWLESGIFIVLALAAAAATLWWVLRRAN